MNIEGAIAILKILIFFRRHGYIPVGYRHSRNSDWLGSISRNTYERKPFDSNAAFRLRARAL